MKISAFKHRVALCTAYDEALTEIAVLLKREKAFDAWAAIDPVRGSFWLNQFAERENRESPSHTITIRWSPNYDISGYAWLFEQRAKSGGRWFKVLSVQELDDKARWWVFGCRLVEKGNTVTPGAPADEGGMFAPRPLRD
jgi:hypothetical protein